MNINKGMRGAAVWALLLVLPPAGVWGQTFALEGGVRYGFAEGGAVSPRLGAELGFSRFILMAALDGSVSRSGTDYPNAPTNNGRETQWDLGFTAGIAPVAAAGGSWRLTLPLLARLGYRKTTSDYDVTSYTDFEYKTLSLGLRAGARASWAVSERWRLYTGFALDLAEWTKEDRYRYWGGGMERDYTYTYLRWFRNPVWELGVLFTLGGKR